MVACRSDQLSVRLDCEPNPEKRMTSNRIFRYQSRYGRLQGHVLIVVLLLMMVGIFTITMATSLIITTSQSHASRMEADSLRTAADSGVENAILNIRRNPGYTGGSTTIDGAVVNTSVVAGADYTITATASSGLRRQAFRVKVARTNGILSVTDWTSF